MLRDTKHIIHPKADYVLPHSHDFYEVVYYISGMGRTSFSGKDYRYEKDTLAVLSPGISHDERVGNTSEVVFCQFEDKLGLNFQSRIFYKNEFNAELLELIKQKMLEIHKNYKNGAGDTEAMNKLIWDLNLHLFRLANDSERDKDKFVKNIIDTAKVFIDKNFTKAIDYQILAESLGYSYDRFRHMFKDFEKITIDKYKYSLRLGYAKHWLQKSGASVSEIAKKCGFSTSPRFCLWFKKEMDITPLKYRKMLGKEWYHDIYNPGDNKAEFLG